MKQVLIMIILLGCFNLLVAQPAPLELQRKIAGKKNLKAIMQEVEKFYEKEEEEKEREKKRAVKKGSVVEEEEEFENELLHWKRWEYFNKTRLKPNGDLEDVNAKTIAAWQLTNTKYDTLARTQSGSNAAWNFIGPYNLQFQGGLYRGTSRIDKIVFHPTNANIIFAGANNGGLWRTLDGGNSWTSLNFYFPIQSASGIVVNPGNPNNIFVLTGDGNGGGGFSQNSCGIWVTNDGGNNWFKTNFNSNAQNPVFNGFKLVMMPQLTYILFAATQNGLYRSTDAGMNWSLVLTGTVLTFPNGSVTSPVYDVEFDPSQPGRVYASSWGRFYVSETYGSSFPLNESTVIPNTNRVEIAVTPANYNYVYLLTGPFGAVGTSTFGGLYRSVVGGTANSFSQRANTPNILCWNTNGRRTAGDGDQSTYDLAIAASPTNAELVVTGGKNIWRSTAGGMGMQNLTVFNEDSGIAKYVHPDVHDIAYNPLNGWLYAGTDGGIYRSTNDGVNWTNITNGIHATTFYHMAAAPFDVNRVLGGTQDNGVKYKSNTGDFTHITGADGFDCAFGPSATSSIYTTVNSSFLKFDINGNTQATNTPANAAFFPVIAADPVTNNVVYMAAGAAGIFKTTNGGTNWNLISAQNMQQSICTCPNNANRVYVTSNNVIIRTDNGGTTWSTNLAANPGFINNGQITDINVCSANSSYVYVTLGGYAAGQKVMYSNDAGANWFSVSGTLPAEVKVNCVVVDQGNNAYIGTDMGVYYQAVSSSDWTPFYNELPRVPVTDLAVNQGSSRIRASTYGHGIWETGLFTTCDANFSLTGAIAGQKFYQASSQITSTVQVVGGNQTKVTARAGNEIVLLAGATVNDPAFTVYEGNEFYGILGPCESGPVPNLSGRAADVPAAFTSHVGKGNDSTLYPYGFITINQPEKATATVIINALQAGNFLVIISDKNGGHENNFLQEEMTAGQTLVKPLNNKGFAKGYYLVQLYYNGNLVHVQELIVSTEIKAASVSSTGNAIIKHNGD